MRRHLASRRPSPAMIVAMIALIVAISGTAYAKIKLPANSVKSKQIAKNAATGKDVKESSFGIVPRASQAGFAKIAAVNLPNFTQHICQDVSVTVPGVHAGDAVVLTPSEPLAAGNDQLAMNVAQVDDGAVKVRGCISTQATIPVDPGSTNYRFQVLP